MFIESKNRAQFESELQAKAMLDFSSAIANKLCALTRKNLGIPIVSTSAIEIGNYTAKDYIETVTGKFEHKIGIQFDESTFIAIGINKELITKCSYYWAGGRRTAPISLSGRLTSCEQAFLDQFLLLLKPVMENISNLCMDDEFLVTDFDDSGIAFKNDQHVQLNTVECTFKDEKIQLSIITSDGVMGFMNLGGAKDGKTKNDANFIDPENLDICLDVRFEKVTMPLKKVKNLQVGDHIPINNNKVDLINDTDGKALFTGMLGHDEHTDITLIQITK